jgi:hypothetical protein
MKKWKKVNKRVILLIFLVGCGGVSEALLEGVPKTTKLDGRRTGRNGELCECV